MSDQLSHRSRPAARRLMAAALVSTALVAVGGGWRLAGAQSQAPANAPFMNAPVADRGYAELVAAVQPSVVNIAVEGTGRGGPGSPGGPGGQQRSPFDDPEMRRFFERFFGQLPPQGQPSPERVRGEGSGFVIDAEGHVVTNAHVVNGATEIEVTFQDETQLSARLVGIDERTDLAVLKVESERPLPYVTFGDSGQMRPGNEVVAVGNPFGLGGTVTTGIVSATGREIGAGPYDDFLQIDAAINRGNSGGPTFNLKGEVIGVNSAIFSPNGGSIGIGFAIASNLAQQVVSELIEDGTVDRGWLGVSIQPVDEDLARSLDLAAAGGALVNSVEPNSPAEEAGIQRGDVVTEFEGRPIEDPRDLSRAVAADEPGRRANLTLVRDGQRQTLNVALGQQPSTEQVAGAQAPAEEDAGQARLGLALAPLTRESRQELGIDGERSGVVVANVVPGSPADDKGIEAGDVIMTVDRQPVTEPREVAEAVRAAADKGEKAVLLLVFRDGRELFQAVPLTVS